MPPDTPDFAGSPTVWNHSPAPSYMPHVAITLRTERTVPSDAARWPVTGLRPADAIVAAIVARSRTSTSTAQHLK